MAVEVTASASTMLSAEASHSVAIPFRESSAAMKVVHGGTQVDPQGREVGQPEAVVILEDVGERRSGECFKNQHRRRHPQDLVQTDDVGVAQPSEKASLAKQLALRLAVVDTLWTENLGDAAAPALLAPDIVDVSHPSAA